MPSSRLPFPRVNATNKRSRPDAISEASATEEVQVLLKHDDSFFHHFELYVKGSGSNYAGRRMHCKFMFKGFKAGRAKARFGQIIHSSM